MVLDPGDGSFLIPVAEGVDDPAVPLHQIVAKILVGDVAVEQEDVDLGAQSGPGVDEAAVVARPVEEIVEAKVELGGFALGDAAGGLGGHRVDDDAHFAQPSHPPGRQGWGPLPAAMAAASPAAVRTRTMSGRDAACRSGLVAMEHGSRT